MRILFIPFLLLAAATPSAGQETLADLLAEPWADLRDPESRGRVVELAREIATRRRELAHRHAAAQGLPIRVSRPNGALQELVDLSDDQPVYLTTHNATAAISTGADLVRFDHQADGDGITIGMWDGGTARSSHQEFGERIVVSDDSIFLDHATHVAGTLIAGGIVPSAMGMSPAGLLNSYDWNGDTAEMASLGATSPDQPDKLYLSNHSYGFVGGWNYVNDNTRVWEWHGNGTDDSAIDEDFGRYNIYARDQDALAFNAPYYLIFRSAGNERLENPTTGEKVALSPGSETVVPYDAALHPAGDGDYRAGFDTIGHAALAKNVVTIGSTTDAVSGGIRDFTRATISGFSSWGPTDDGRIKPDLVANGEHVYSALDSSDTAYGSFSGTSMSAPNATGSAALLIELYGRLFPGQAMRSSTLKGLLIHTTDDRGNPGPDYQYGWGLINASRAANLLADHHQYPEKQRLGEDQLTTSVTSRSYPFVWDGTSPIRATLCWTDPAGSSTTISDRRTPVLVNDLNLKIVAPDHVDHLPYVMPFVGTWSESMMDAPATTGVNATDNVEQVFIAEPLVTGTYNVVVSVTGSLVNDRQRYALVLSGSSADLPPPPPLAIEAVAPASGLAGPITLNLMGKGFRADTSVMLARAGESTIPSISVTLLDDTLRCQFDLTSAPAGMWDIVATNPDSEIFTLSVGFHLIDALWSESFDGGTAPAGWSTQAETGSSGWTLTNARSHSPTTSQFAPAPSSKTTTHLVTPEIVVPAGAADMELRFWHRYSLQTDQDGGRLEFSLDDGAWFGVDETGSGTAFASNGYNATIRANGPPRNRSPFAGLRAWSGNSAGFVETVVSFTDSEKYAGHTLRIRWSLATNEGTSSEGWHLDTIALLGGRDTGNEPPIITSAPNSSSDETQITLDGTVFQVVRDASVGLTVTAEDDGDEGSLIYTWSIEEGPDLPVFFSANATNAARATTGIFQGHGDYRIAVSVKDAQGLTVTDTLDIRVVQEASGLAVSPGLVSLTVGGSQQFTAALLDQFSNPIIDASDSVAWMASGGGLIEPTGIFTATNSGGPFIITASNGAFNATANATVNPSSATITLDDLRQTFDGAPKAVSVATEPAGLSVHLTYDGASTPPSATGTYAVAAVVSDPDYQGETTGTLTINPGPATITLDNLTQTFDGTPKAVSVATEPAGLAVHVTYDGAATPPSATGTYAVAAVVSDPDYRGEATGTLTIDPGDATITLDNLTQTFDGSPKAVSVTTEPAGLAVHITYDGASTPPSATGSYAVVAVVSDPSYEGETHATLEIAPQDFVYWQDRHFTDLEQAAGLADPSVDFDQDGVVNLMEYALGSEPRSPGPSVPVKLFQENRLGEIRPVLQFTRPVGLPDIDYVVEVAEMIDGSETLHWRGVTDFEVTPLDPPTTERVVTNSLLSIDQVTCCVLRLRVSLISGVNDD